MVTLWNDLRLAYGMAPMGFINPFLYAAYASTPEAFNDVVTGNNACSAGNIYYIPLTELDLFYPSEIKLECW